MFSVVGFKLFKENLRVIEQLQTGCVEPIFFFLDGPLDLLHHYFMTFGLNLILEQDNSATKHQHCHPMRIL